MVDTINTLKPLSFFISAGHSIKDCGATSGPFKENLLCMKFRDALVESLRSMGFVCVVPNDSLSLSETIEAAKGLSCDVNIDLHFNAGPESAYGAEVFFNRDAHMQWKRFLGDFIFGLCERVQQKCRGSKSEVCSPRKTLAFLKLPRSLLLEIEFLTNKEATDRLLLDIQGWAKSCAYELSFLAVRWRKHLDDTKKSTPGGA